MTHHLYISPHLDDAVFSCGGCMLQQTAQGERVTVITVFAGDPPQGPLSEFARSLHDRWGIDREGAAIRRTEDRVACARLDAMAVHLEFPEAIYRKAGGVSLYDSEEAIFGEVHPVEVTLEEQVLAALMQRVHSSMCLYAPMGLGGHVDHRVVRRVAEQLELPVSFYPDFPYAARGMVFPAEQTMPEGMPVHFDFQLEEIEEWVSVICEYRTQLSTFWGSYADLQIEMQSYAAESRAVTLYRSS